MVDMSEQKTRFFPVNEKIIDPLDGSQRLYFARLHHGTLIDFSVLSIPEI